MCKSGNDVMSLTHICSSVARSSDYGSVCNCLIICPEICKWLLLCAVFSLFSLCSAGLVAADLVFSNMFNFSYILPFLQVQVLILLALKHGK